ncbi:MAG: 4-hydroxy-3-methylbut-2-enyl diphosphate reductase [Nocardioidaceae bacterium]
MRHDVVFCTPLRMEAKALRSGLSPAGARSVVTTGAGRQHAHKAAADPRLQNASATAVVGIAGALDPRLQPGDVVVADELRDNAGVCSATPHPTARMVAAQLRRDGLRVWVGPVLSSDHMVTGAEREVLASSGALAVDMESAWLAPSGRPGVVVRVAADVAGERLLQPSTLGRVRTAVRTLPKVAPSLQEWAHSIGPRTVLLAEPRSFCAGVERAIEVVERALEQRGAPIYVRKQIVHNQHVVSQLQERGAVFVEELADVPEGSTVVFSAHGVSPAVWGAARERELDIIDATCPLVTKVHSEVRRFGDRGDSVIFIGHAGHEETEGTMGERPEQTVLVESADDAAEVEVADPERVSYLVQTTLSAHEVEGVVDVLRGRFPNLRAPASDDICYATTNRQDALQAVALDSDLVLVVGSQNSSNSQRLVETSERWGTPAYLVDDVGDIDLAWLAGADTVGLTAGASAPRALVDEVVDAMRGLGPVEVQDRQLVTENVHFTLPKEVRPA